MSLTICARSVNSKAPERLRATASTVLVIFAARVAAWKILSSAFVRVASSLWRRPSLA